MSTAQTLRKSIDKHLLSNVFENSVDKSSSDKEILIHQVATHLQTPSVNKQVPAPVALVINNTMKKRSKSATSINRLKFQEETITESLIVSNAESQASKPRALSASRKRSGLDMMNYSRPSNQQQVCYI